MVYLLRKIIWFIKVYSLNGGAHGVTVLPEYKSTTRLFAFHIALIPLGKVRTQLFSLQLGVK